MSDEERALYADTVREPVLIRRYTGVGPTRPFFDTPTFADVTGERPEQLVGTINQYDYAAVVLVRPLIDAGFALPITGNDFIVWQGKAYKIMFPDNATRRGWDGTLLAYVVNFKGN